MFTERLNEIMAALDIPGNGEFALLLGCDRSYISLLRGGKRTPAPGSRAAARLTEALCARAAGLGQTERLRALAGASPETEETALPAAVEEWLLAEEPPRQPRRKRGGRRPEIDAESALLLGSRLSAAMEQAELSNVRLSQLSNVDASVISRYRRGQHIPRKRDTMEWICRVLYQRIGIHGGPAALARLTGLPEAAFASGGETEGFSAFRGWLLDAAQADGSAIGGFLADLDAFSPPAERAFLPAAEAAGAEKHGTAALYRGPEGLRAAALRFLYGALESGAEELLLYSDETMDWMTADADFVPRWASLMRALVRAGTRVRIIHNIDRGLEEMTAAIRGWLPLYMSGRIEGWYSRKSAGERFSHTIFLAPGRACISACCPAGRQRDTLYRYDTDGESLAFWEEAYRELLSGCLPLIRLQLEDGGGGPASPEPDRGGDGSAVLPTLSLATMPEALLHRIADRAALPPARRRALAAEWERERARLERRSVTELFPLAEAEALRAGRVAVDAASAALIYTPEEYALHARSLLDRAETAPGYRAVALPEAAFQNIRILVTGKAVTVRRLSPPAAAFTVTHPLMHAAFASYIDRLRALYQEPPEALRERLRQFL